jgi:tetratricopeptide (TPR) repeat protein
MAPEQANGEWERADERLDVFGLGGILCAVLTGEPPYRGRSEGEVLRKAQRGDLAEAFARLDGGGADAALVALAKECLSPERDARPRDAGVVAGRVRAYLAAVQEQLRAAEVERAAAQARAEEAVKKAAAERRARRLGLGLAAAVLVVLVLGLGAAVYWQQQRQRAREEAESHRKLLVESYAQAARLAMRRGDWKDALVQLKLALEAGHLDDVALRFDRARAYQATHEITLAREELQGLADRSDLGRYEGQVLLWCGYMLLDQGKPEGQKRVQQALRKDLPGAELAFARGLLAASSTEAVQHFEQAITLDPFHHTANVLAVSQRLFLGQREAARERIDFARRIFPDDPTFVLLQALLLALEGKKEEGTALFERVSSRFTEPQRRTARAILEFLSALALVNNELDGTSEISTWQVTWRFMQAWLRVGALTQEGDEGQLSLPLPPTFRAGLKIASQRALELQIHLNAGSLPRFVRPNPAGVLADLEAAEAVHPDGVFAFMRALVLGSHDRLGDAERALARAAEQSSLLHVGPASLCLGALCATKVGLDKAQAGAMDEARQAGARAIRSLRELLRLGEVRSDWAGGMVAVALGNDEIDLARHILREWELRQPNAPAIPQARLDVESRAGAWGRVIEIAQQILAKQPGDRKVQQTLADAREQLRQQAARLAPQPR